MSALLVGFLALSLAGDWIGALTFRLRSSERGAAYGSPSFQGRSLRVVRMAM